jgi:hypothetical protein
MRYEDGSGSSLASCIGTLIADTPLQRALSLNALTLYEARFAFDKVYGDLVARLTELAALRVTGRAGS